MIRVYLILISVFIVSACSGPSSKHSNDEKPAIAKAETINVEKELSDEQLNAEIERARMAAEKKEQQAAEKARLEAEKLAQEKKLAEEKLALAQAEKKAEQELAAKELAKQQEAELALQTRAEQEAAEREAAVRDAQEKAAGERAAKEAAAARERERLARQQAAGTGFSIPNFQAHELGGAVLTPVGAERAGNKAGTIPEWKGTMRSAPNGAAFRSGSVYPDPYKGDKTLFTIRADNMMQYKEYLSEGLRTLFQKYPDTFYMNIYPSHREGRYSDLIEQRTAWNSKNTQLVNGVDGLSDYTGGVPFPKPKNANEVLWNGRIIHPTPTVNGVFDDIAVYLNGNKQQRRQQFVSDFPFASQDNPVGMGNDEIGINAAYVHVTVEKPDRLKGQMTIIHEALDQMQNERMAWVYIPGSRRVRRAPTVGYDTPDGPGGLVTVDDSLGFNGAMDRYDWKLLGKKEMYIPYHNYKFDTPNVDYDVLLQKGHANPEYMRYELHRVWVVEANLKRGARHVYLKRRFYIDEDSWHIVLVESFDGRGDLWRVGILNTVYDFAVQGFVARAQMFHDVQSGGYIAMRLVNNTAPARLMDSPKGESYYSPANLRKLGR